MIHSPPSCSSLDVYLDGDLDADDARAFERHAESCAACTADLAASRLLEAEWAAMAAETAPPTIITAALETARRGRVDRAPMQSVHRRRRPRFAIAGVLAAALALTVVWLQRDAAPAAPPLAEQAGAPAAETPTTETPASMTSTTPSVEASPPEAPVGPTADMSLSPRRTPPPRPAPARAPAPPAPLPAASADVPAPLAATDALPDSVAQAQSDLLLALALVADVQSRASSTVTAEIQRATTALSDSPIF